MELPPCVKWKRPPPSNIHSNNNFISNQINDSKSRKVLILSKIMIVSTSLEKIQELRQTMRRVKQLRVRLQRETAHGWLKKRNKNDHRILSQTLIIITTIQPTLCRGVIIITNLLSTPMNLY